MSDTARDSRVGSRFGRYHLKRLLGRGGMGEVYEAEDTVKERVVALKLLSLALCQDPVFRERLQREARTAGRLQEPHVVPVHDYGEIDGQLYLDMRLIEGTDLSALLKRSGALAPPQAVAIVRQAASALDAAHAAGVIHRDIKPENILITRDDFAYLVDFGIASATADERLTQAGQAVGTWKYAAPERFTNAAVTHSVDVYALACVLHECLTGSPPYRADSAGMLITAHLMEPIPRPSKLRPGIPAAFDDVIAGGMAKEAKDRYGSAGELALAANEALSARDQDRASDIVEHSQEATLPSTEANPPARSAPPTPRVPASQPPAGTPSPRTGGSALPHSLPSPATGTGWGTTREPPHSPAGRPRGAPPFGPGGTGWPGQFGVPVPRVAPQRPVPRQQKAGRLRGIAALVAVAAVGVLIVWLLLPSNSTPEDPGATEGAEPSTTTSAPAPTTPAAETQARLFSALPPGYPPGACKAVTPGKDALAKVSCGRNSDPDGPPSATYVLFPDNVALRAAFATVVKTTAAVDCPGRIQSPGPWHRNATPGETSGVLLCGMQHGYPAVAWTNDAELLVSVVQSELRGPTLEQLYLWWTSHS
jgi:serine/threonine-protein kinase